MVPFGRLSKWIACSGIALGLALPQAQALLNIDGTRNQLFVFGSLTFGYNSNIFAESSGRGDYTLTAQAGAELQRRAGIIAVNAIAKVDVVTYDEYTDENSVNPNFSLDFTKSTGRTTGSLRLRAYRETRSDSAVNLRTSSWNFPITLDLRYPLNQKSNLGSESTFLHRTFDDHSLGLLDYTDFSEAINLYYKYTSKLDLVGGYRVRYSRTSDGEHALDHWFNVGATGNLLTKLTGTIRFGYQLRDTSGLIDENFDHFNVLASVLWPITRKISLNFQAVRDFGTIATGGSVDSTSLAAYAQYAFSRKIDFRAGASVGRNNFLGALQADRRDTFFSWDAGATYRLNEHLQISATYSYFHNWSTLSLSDFDSHGISLQLSARY